MTLYMGERDFLVGVTVTIRAPNPKEAERRVAQLIDSISKKAVWDAGLTVALFALEQAKEVQRSVVIGGWGGDK